MKKVCVVGAGYVGLSISVLLAEDYDVTVLEIDNNKIDSINNRSAFIEDKDIQDYFSNKELNLCATSDKETALKECNYIVIATPTNYDIKTNSFDTRSVKNSILEAINFSSDAEIIIKSTVPVGFTKEIADECNIKKLCFSPEFLREGKALHDNLYPSRIVIGNVNEFQSEFGSMLASAAKADIKPEIHIMSSTEAEAVKLFSNTYLAMRVAFFNELDTFCDAKRLSTLNVINGVCSDPRIGNTYNNPSFGYGGYCLPKDTRQLLANYEGVPNELMLPIIKSNNTRKSYIIDEILKKNPKTVGVYKLAMKKGSDNFRDSAVLTIIDELVHKKIEVLIYDPLIKTNKIFGAKVIDDLKLFFKQTEIIIANRTDKKLNAVKDKIYSRDIYEKD